MTAKQKTRNASIDIFCYFCAIFVVILHTGFSSDTPNLWSYFLGDAIPRIAVPFFFAVSGYYYIQKLERGEKPFRPYVKRLLTVYALWTALYYFVDFVQWGHDTIKGYVANCVISFVVWGSHYHFWFFPALLFAVGFTTLLYRLRWQKMLFPVSAVLLTAGCLGCAYYGIGIQIPILRNVILSPHFVTIRRILFTGVPFFAAGSLVYRLQQRLQNVNEKIIFGGGVAGCCPLAARTVACL